jgi:hypothetical protein
MDSLKVRRVFTLERIANGTVLLSVLVAFTILCFNVFINHATPRIEAGLAKGRVLPPLANYGQYPSTLLLVMNTECGHCKTSLPFYQKLITSNREGDKTVHIVALFPNDASEVDRFLTENKFEVDHAANVDLSQLMITGTPSLILVNARGEIADFWLGKLDDVHESQILASLFHKNAR